MTDCLVTLSPEWRIVDSPPSWSVEERVRVQNEYAWRSRRRVRDKAHLLLSIEQLCGSTVDAEAVKTIRSWASDYVGWKVALIGPIQIPQYILEMAST